MSMLIGLAYVAFSVGDRLMAVLALPGFIALFGATYAVLYWRIVRFRPPRWLAGVSSSQIRLRHRPLRMG